ncbi:MAG: T9SS type A sorting domain-containing protein [Flavobacteriales bacterium]|nr:T9SS type A sorting domain-containing protein [Flavobacteriales bacterium]
MKKILTLFIPFLLGLPLIGVSQEINGYAKVANIAGLVLTLNNVDETNATFEDGDRVIIMQMQDNVIGSTSNDATFGNIGSILSAGMYEVVTINSHTEVAGVPTSITVSSAFLTSYNTGVNSSLQIITYPTLGSPDYVTTSNMSAKSWDGNTGGVLAFSVSGILTLAHNIEVDGDGFRGALANGGGSTGCSGSSNYRIPSTNNHADKGEGIYKITNVNYVAGRAKILSGGGGGNSHNAGGGGGSNFSAGGVGGPGWPNCTPAAGGYGGIDLSAYIGASRVFMGGGGGAGEGNNGFSQNAGNGGGIILINAAEIRTSGACGGLTITANGESVTTSSGNDGSSAGGAAGSIVFHVPVWNVSASCPVTIQANGGDGGNVASGATHGGGSGGGMGALVFSSDIPSTNVTLNTAPGNGGNNCLSCDPAGGGEGTDGDGIVGLLVGPLPIDLISFEANANEDRVDLKRITASEINNDFFTIEKSVDAKNWEEVVITAGAGNSNQILEYFETDYEPLTDISYYRLKQTDFDGQFSYSNVVPVKFVKDNTDGGVLNLFPSPVSVGETVHVEFKNIFESELLVVLRDIRGREFYSKVIVDIEDGKLIGVPIEKYIPAGVYLITATSENQMYSQKLIIK